jgi:hypothetical protein
MGYFHWYPSYFRKFPSSGYLMKDGQPKHGLKSGFHEQYMMNYKISVRRKGIAITCILMLALLFGAYAQTPGEFHHKSAATNKTAMWMLGTWAAGNMLAGGIGMSRSQGSTHYFHQMNLMWNTVNMGIATFGLLSGSSVSGLSFEEIMATHRKAENLYLINAGLDLVYIAAGAYMLHRSERTHKKPDLLSGYGKSVILQGGFLLLFDTAFWMIQRNLRLSMGSEISLGTLTEYPGLALRLYF